jgi:hypothetical protein
MVNSQTPGHRLFPKCIDVLLDARNSKDKTTKCGPAHHAVYLITHGATGHYRLPEYGTTSERVLLLCNFPIIVRFDVFLML